MEPDPAAKLSEESPDRAVDHRLVDHALLDSPHGGNRAVEVFDSAEFLNSLGA
jgi:hypothetical protein